MQRWWWARNWVQFPADRRLLASLCLLRSAAGRCGRLVPRAYIFNVGSLTRNKRESWPTQSGLAPCFWIRLCNSLSAALKHPVYSYHGSSPPCFSADRRREMGDQPPDIKTARLVLSWQLCITNGYVLDAALHHFERVFSVPVPAVLAVQRNRLTSQSIAVATLAGGQTLLWLKPPHSGSVRIPKAPTELVNELAQKLRVDLQNHGAG